MKRCDLYIDLPGWRQQGQGCIWNVAHTRSRQQLTTQGSLENWLRFDTCTCVCVLMQAALTKVRELSIKQQLHDIPSPVTPFSSAAVFCDAAAAADWVV